MYGKWELSKQNFAKYTNCRFMTLHAQKLHSNIELKMALAPEIKGSEGIV
jgi:hypothetical protein